MNDRIREILSWYGSDNAGTRTNLARLLSHGKLAGSGKLVMNTGAATTSYLGGITASAGTLVAGSGTPFPTNNDNNITLTSATLDLNGFDVRLRRMAGVLPRSAKDSTPTFLWSGYSRMRRR